MMTRSKAGLLGAWLFAALLGPLSAPAQEVLDQDAMKQVMAKTLTYANKRLEATHRQGKPKSVRGLEMISEQGGGTWKMQLLVWGQAGGWFGDEVPLQLVPAVIYNRGDRAEFFGLGPSMPTAALDALEKDGKLGKAMRESVQDRSDVSITFGRHEQVSC